MISIADAVAKVSAAKDRVVFLDACDILYIVQSLTELDVDSIKRTPKFLDLMAQGSAAIQLVTTEIVQVEFVQNVAKVEQEARIALRQFDERLRSIHRAWEHLNQKLPFVPANYVDPPAPDLVASLRDLAQQLLAKAITIESDKACVQNALERVYAQRRPAQKGAIKDSIHLEHALELVRQLRQIGHSERCVFVSANRSDYWLSKGDSRLHPELNPEFSMLNLEFFGHLDHALGSLGV